MRTTRLPLALLALGSLTACTRVVEVHTVEATAPETTIAEDDQADHLIASVYSLVAGPVYASDAQIIELATLVCRSLDDGSTLDDLSAIFTTTADGDRDMERLFAAITVVAIMELCPQHEALLRAHRDLV